MTAIRLLPTIAVMLGFCVSLAVAQSPTTQPAAIPEQPPEPSALPQRPEAVAPRIQPPPPPPTPPQELPDDRPMMTEDIIADVLAEQTRTVEPLPVVPLERQPPIVEPNVQAPHRGTDNAVPTRLIPAGEVLPLRARLLQDDRGYYLQAVEGAVLRRPPFRVMPNRLLESMLDRDQAVGDVTYDVVGRISIFRDENYILLRSARIVPNLGNLE